MYLPAIVLAIPAALSGGKEQPKRRLGRGVAVFLGGTFAFGLAGSAAYNRFWDEFIFTWPAALFVPFQLTLLAIPWAEGKEDEQRRRARWGSRGAALFFLLTCGLYFLLCRRLSAMHEWVFLIGFLPAVPLTVLAARRLLTPGRLTAGIAWGVAAFSIYFWSCGGFLIWKSWSEG